MEIILIEKIEKLGDVGDLVSVKNGYARNFLLRQNKALRATDENKAYFEEKKKDILAKNEEIKKEAKKIYDKINDKAALIIAHASDEGRLFGSVMPKDIAVKLSESTGVDIKKSQIVLSVAIREVGLYEAKVRIHADYLATVKVNVARNEEEAKENLKPKKEKAEAAPEESAVEAEAPAANEDSQAEVANASEAKAAE